MPSFLKSAEDRGWKVERLEHLIANKVIVGHLDGNHGSLYPRSSEFVDAGIKYISANALINSKVDLTKTKFLTAERGGQFKKGIAKSGDVLFAHNATVGPVAILETTDNFVIISTSLTYYRCNPTKLDNIYLSQYMSSPSFIRQYERIMKQTTRSQVPITAQRDLYFVLPPLPEQQKIAKILSTWDKAIGTTERLIDNSTQQKKALMQQLLTGKKRLLDDAGERFSGDWEEVELSKWLVEYKEKSSTQDQYDVYTSSRNGLVLQSEYFANSRISGRNNIGFHVIPPNHITYRSRSDDGFFTFNLFSNDKKGLISNYYPVFSTKGSNKFFIQLFEQYRSVFGRYSVGTSQKVLSLNSLKGILFEIPPLPEQQKIAAVLTNADQEIDLLKQQLADLQQEKKALMQQLLTGKRRVVVEDVIEK